MSRIVALVDGFNLYHSIAERVATEPRFQSYKWLDLNALIKTYYPKGVQKILYFTSLTLWDGVKVERHRTLIKAMESTGIETIYGKFKDKDRTCPRCGKRYKSREEKQTDVGIALMLFRLAYEKNFDMAVLLTGDSDQLPTIKQVHQCFPGFRVEVLLPIGREALELKTEADYYGRIRERVIKKCRFQETLTLTDGTNLKCPDAWKEPV